jgi:hypothetical protein
MNRYHGAKVLSSDPPSPPLERYRRLVQRVVGGGIPHGEDFDACRMILASEPSSSSALTALCVLLEGALADPSFDIDATQTLVPLLKELAQGRVHTEELL